MAAPRSPGWWYPWIFVAAFVVVVGVNATMAWFATSTFTGLETEGAYEKGLAYNTNIALAKAQAELGWSVEPMVRPLADDAQHRTDIAIRYRDSDGKPVEGLEVRARLIRPTTKGYDRDVVLEPRGDGVYGLVTELALPGVWDMEVVAIGNGVSYQLAHRFVAP